ncbi:MAG: hypothetical protein QOI47_1299, partial [Actinomycetota bacterium]|nr:hypothetical protein [Actinomycetota bacterium]
MRSAARWAVVAAVTAIDVAILTVLAHGAGVPVALADTASVAIASAVSWVLHREVTYGGDLNIRWVRRPQAFALAAVIAGGVDVAVTSLGAITLALLA